MREGLAPIGGRQRDRLTPHVSRWQHPKRCIDPEDGSIECVCGLSDAQQEAADAAVEQWEARQ